MSDGAFSVCKYNTQENLKQNRGYREPTYGCQNVYIPFEVIKIDSKWTVKS